MDTQDQSIEKSLEKIINFLTSDKCYIKTGIIEKINGKQSVNVKPNIKKAIKDKKGKTVYIDYPVIPKVPLFILATKNYFLSMPVAVGDTCLLLFNDHNLDTYLETDGKSEIEIEDFSRNQLSNAIAIVGIPTPMNKIDEISTTDMVMGKINGNSKITITNDDKIKVKGNEILLGSDSANIPVADATKTNSRIQALETWAGIVGSALTLIGIANTPPTGSSVASSNVKING